MQGPRKCHCLCCGAVCTGACTVVHWLPECVLCIWPPKPCNHCEIEGMGEKAPSCVIDIRVARCAQTPSCHTYCQGFRPITFRSQRPCLPGFWGRVVPYAGFRKPGPVAAGCVWLVRCCCGGAVCPALCAGLAHDQRMLSAAAAVLRTFFVGWISSEGC